MATFKVGDRVRMVRPYHAENMGAEGTIADLFPVMPSSVPGWPVNCRVDWDRPMRGRLTNTFQLAPILPAPSAADILAMANLLERDCIAPVTLNAPEWPRWEAA